LRRVSDLKTLRLASLQLSPERLEGFLTYQRTLLTELARAPASDWSGRYAFAHGRALAASQLDLVELGKLKSMVGDFCGRRSAAQHVKERLAKSGDSAKDAQIAERAQKGLPKLDDLSKFTARYGAEAVTLLESREAELLTLHRELAKQEGTGHLHPGS
jgi:hypothetical protein